MARKSLRREKRTLRDSRIAIHLINDKLQPCFSGHQHFSPQSKDLWASDCLDAPEVKRFSFNKMVWITSTTAQADTAHEPIHQPTNLPRPRSTGIPVFPSD